MSLDSITHLIVQVSQCPYAQILGTLWITYSYLLFKGGHVSDDLQGIQAYDGTLMYPVEDKDGKTSNDKDGKVIKARKVCYGTLSKWVRYFLAGGHFPSRHHYKLPPDKPGDKPKDGEAIPSGKIPTHHHFLSILAQSVASILLYQFLLTVTTPTVAIMTTLLFIVHPTCLQAVAWPSAIGYILSLICICSTLLISHWMYDFAFYYPTIWPGVFGLLGIAFFSSWGVYAQG